MEGIKSSPVILYCSYSSPCGDLLLGATEDRLCLCDWKTRPNQEKIFQRLNRYLNAEWREGNSCILQKASCQLDEYFSGKRETFDIPLLTIGSPFQQDVWKLLQKIPYVLPYLIAHKPNDCRNLQQYGPSLQPMEPMRFLFLSPVIG